MLLSRAPAKKTPKSTAETAGVVSPGEARMVDVAGKPHVLRTAKAQGSVYMSGKTVKLIRQGKVPKGDVFSVAKVAGIMAAKKTPDIIPLCHPLNLSSVEISLKLLKDMVRIESKVSCIGPTGVEMEALASVAASALALYDMCKGLDSEMRISDIILIEKKKTP